MASLAGDKPPKLQRDIQANRSVLSHYSPYHQRVEQASRFSPYTMRRQTPSQPGLESSAASTPPALLILAENVTLAVFCRRNEACLRYRNKTVRRWAAGRRFRRHRPIPPETPALRSFNSARSQAWADLFRTYNGTCHHKRQSAGLNPHNLQAIDFIRLSRRKTWSSISVRGDGCILTRGGST